MVAACRSLTVLTYMWAWFIFHYDFAGLTRTDEFAQDALIVQDTEAPAFGFRFPPLVTEGHFVQHNGGMQGSCGCPLARCEDLLVPVIAARRD